MTASNLRNHSEQPEVCTPQSIIELESGNQLGDVNIGTVAGRDVFNVHVHLPATLDKTVREQGGLLSTFEEPAQASIQVGSIFKLSVHPLIATVFSIPLLAWIASTAAGAIIWIGAVNLIKVENALTTYLGVVVTTSFQWFALQGKIRYAWSWVVLHALVWAGAILGRADTNFYSSYLVPTLLLGGPILLLINGKFIKPSDT